MTVPLLAPAFYSIFRSAADTFTKTGHLQLWTQRILPERPLKRCKTFSIVSSRDLRALSSLVTFGVVILDIRKNSSSHSKALSWPAFKVKNGDWDDHLSLLMQLTLASESTNSQRRDSVSSKWRLGRCGQTTLGSTYSWEACHPWS